MEIDVPWQEKTAAEKIKILEQIVTGRYSRDH
jgi:hypothetical protein